MITGLETFAIPTFLTLAGNFAKCDTKPLPRIRTHVQNERVVHDSSKSHADLAQFQIDTISPYGSSVHTKVSGLMSGNINVSMSANIAWSTNPITKTSCVWYDEIDINLTSKPTIFIASEHKNNKCRYNVTLKHEQKHVKVDKQIISKFTPYFTREVKKAIRQISVVGPIRSDDVEQARIDMNNQIQRVIENVLDEMKVERRKRQQAVDSRQEYDRLSRLCGGR